MGLMIVVDLAVIFARTSYYAQSTWYHGFILVAYLEKKEPSWNDSVGNGDCMAVKKFEDNRLVGIAGKVSDVMSTANEDSKYGSAFLWRLHQHS